MNFSYGLSDTGRFRIDIFRKFIKHEHYIENIPGVIMKAI